MFFSSTVWWGTYKSKIATGLTLSDVVLSSVSNFDSLVHTHCQMSQTFWSRHSPPGFWCLTAASTISKVENCNVPTVVQSCFAFIVVWIGRTRKKNTLTTYQGHFVWMASNKIKATCKFSCKVDRWQLKATFWWIWKVWIENWWLLLLQKANYSEKCHAAASVRSDNKKQYKRAKKSIWSCCLQEGLFSGLVLQQVQNQCLHGFFFLHKIRALETKWYKLATAWSYSGTMVCLSTS